MSEFEFLNMAVSQWPTLLGLVLLCVGAIWLGLRKFLAAGIYDPLFFTFGVAYGINYGIILLLAVNGLVSTFLLCVLAIYPIVLIVAFRWFSSSERPSLLFRATQLVAQPQLGGPVFCVALASYLGLTYLIGSTIGFGLFAETNRFDAARGYGVIIRVLDCLTPFIISFMTLLGLKNRHLTVLMVPLVTSFILLAAVVNGAKVSVLFGFVTVLVTLFVARPGFRIAPWKVALAMAFGLAFSLLALKVNLDKNNVADQNNAPLSNVSNLVVVRLIYRVIAFGDTSYLVLPNDIIDHLKTDSLAVRFAAPIVGNTNLSGYLGYDVSDYTVGRQAVLVQTADTAVFGGPTSHYDLFAYVYLGAFGGGVFVFVMGALLGLLNRSLLLIKRDALERRNMYLIALCVTLWSRGVLMLMEPGVGFAYLVDAIVIFPAFSLMCSVVAGAAGRPGATDAA